jgi:hypothetical protein
MATINSTIIEETSAGSLAEKLPRWLLHAEGLAVLLGAVAAYAHLGGSGWLFALLLFTPDLAMIGYLRDTRLGAVTYNLAHTYTLVLAVFGLSLAAGWHTGVLLGLILTAHIGLDRTLGYGLKYPSGFKDTHLSRV